MISNPVASSARGDLDAVRPPVPVGDPTYFSSPRMEMLEFVPQSARQVLEIGCGEGSFGALVKARGSEVWGIEIDPTAAEVARKALDNVLVGDVAVVLKDVPTSRFDAVVCNDVLEHLVDPYAVLAAILPKLAPGGVVIASIPNVRHLTNLKNLLVHKDWQYTDSGTLDRTHLRFFTERSIRAMLEGCGYEVLQLRGINGVHNHKYTLLNALTLGFIEDTRWLQFAVVARARKPGQ